MSLNINRILLSVGLILSFVFANCFAAKIEESAFVHSKDTALLRLIANHPELVVDHPGELGFEIYGPKGTLQWLAEQNVQFSSLESNLKGIEGNEALLGYPSHEEITAYLKNIANKYPKITKLFSIGKSVQGRELWVMKISDNAELDEVEPEFKYISSMHGDEITGRELTNFLIKDLVEGYGVKQNITDLVNNTEIFIMPSMNPDGSHLKQRANAQGFDLNRNFPDWTHRDSNTSDNRQLETVALMNFQAQRHFSLSANFHGGAVVVNYPWDSSYELHPLDKLVKELSLDYADLNPEMRNSRQFSGGVTNGADWYVLHGGMQDWSYYWYNDLQVTIELSNTKWPSYSEIPAFYQSNKDSMLVYAQKVHQGAGFKFSTKRSGSVEIVSNGKSLGTFGFFGGEFYKVLETGNYEFRVTSKNKSFNFSVAVDDSIKENGHFELLE